MWSLGARRGSRGPQANSRRITRCRWPRHGSSSASGVIGALARECITDLVREVDVADADRVRIPEGADPCLGGRPCSDTGERRQRIGPPDRCTAGRALDRVGTPRRADDGLRLDPRAMPRPGRDLPPGPWRRRGEQRAGNRARGSIALPGDEPTPRAEGLPHGDLLFEGGLGERVEDEVGAREAHARPSSRRARHDRMECGVEAAGVVVCAAEGGHLRECPFSSGAPRGRPDGSVWSLRERNRREPRGGAGRAPDHAAGPVLRWISGPALQTADRRAQVDRGARPVGGLQGEGHAVTVRATSDKRAVRGGPQIRSGEGAPVPYRMTTSA